MSLTREQWLEMYQSAKKIDMYLAALRRVSNLVRIEYIQTENNKIKESIESVIGQQE